MPNESTNDIELIITRTFDAPRELVWAAWTEPRHLAHWICPDDLVVTFADGDVRPGGTWRSGMCAGNGETFVCGGRYLELDPPRRLVQTHEWENPESSPTKETRIEITLEDDQGKTRMTFRQTGFWAEDARDHHVEGWTGAFNNLTAYLAEGGDPDARYVVIERQFNAPRDLVWRAFTEAQHIAQWWGPKGFTTRVEKNEFRPGGRSSVVMTGPDGTEYPVEGLYIEIDAPNYYITTDEFGEGYQGETLSGIVLTVSFEDSGDGTRVTLHLKHRTAADKKKHEDMGVMEGWGSSFDCLDAYLERQS